MGNAEPQGMEKIFNNHSAINQYDLIVLGLQESTYGNMDSISHLSKYLTDLFGNEYFLVQHCYRAQLQLYVFGKIHLRSRITHIEQSIENTGILHVFPNKVSITPFELKFIILRCSSFGKDRVAHRSIVVTIYL
jgi:hypothetical protein